MAKIEATFSKNYNICAPDLKTDQTIRAPPMKIPTEPSSSSMSFAGRALANLSSLDFSFDMGLSDAVRWAKSSQAILFTTDPFINPQLYLHIIEDLVFQHFFRLFNKEAYCGLLSMEGIEDRTVENMEELLDMYQSVLKDLLKSKYCMSRMKSNLRSHRILVNTAALCFVFDLVECQYEMLKDYSPALLSEDLQHLVLPGKSEIEIARMIFTYITAHQGRRPLFHLGRQSATMQFAIAFGQCHYSSVWKDLSEAAQLKVDQRWEKICQKKERLSSLRSELLVKKSELASFPSFYQSRKRKLWPDEYRTLRDQIRILESDIASTSCAPERIIQALPKNESMAFQWLFFLQMPSCFQFISRFTILCKQMFVPEDPQTVDRYAEKAFSISIADHFKTNLFTLWNVPKFAQNVGTFDSIPMKIGNTTVDLISDRFDGVFHPDSWVLTIQGSPFNPFSGKIEKSDTIQYFTEPLPHESQDLQWALPMIPSSERGNIGLAKLNLRPSWLQKPEYLTFATLRSFPHSQFRNLAICLQQRSLPFERREVQIMIRQIFSEIGPFSPNGTLAWRGDSEDVFQFLAKETIQLAMDLREKKRSDIMLILALMASLMSQYSPAGIECVEVVLQIFGEWTSNVETCISNHPDPLQIGKLRHRQCLYNMYAIICLGGNRPLPDSQLETLCGLSLLVRSGLPDDGIVSDDSHRIADLLDLCYYTLVIRLKELLALVDHHPQSLTRAAQGIIETIPDDMSWSCISGKQTCFESWDVSRNHYAVNILSGVVLVNGLPPRSLPSDILNHPLYRRSFGDTDFETVLLSNGWIESSRLVHGRKYRLHFTSNSKELIIQERRAGDDEDDFLQLLDGIAHYKHLPCRLQKLFSHWHSGKDDSILFRAHSFQDRVPHFVMRNISSSLPVTFSIPNHDQIENRWEDPSFSSKWDRCVQINDFTVTKVLSKFEDIRFIHGYLTHDNKLKIELPRYSLSFELLHESFNSLDYPGMKLSACQQFMNTLPKFSRYLILENAEQQMVLIPNGEIIVSNVVDISPPAGPEQSCLYYAFVTHPRFGTIEALDVESRLFLASLYAASSTHLPDPRCGMTGEEYAMLLLRQCSVMRQLTEKEKCHLQSCSKYSNGGPSLHLLSILIWKTSEQLGFLETQQISIPCPFEKIRDNAHICYINQVRYLSARQCLQNSEEMSLFRFHARSSCATSIPIGCDTVEIPDCPVQYDYVLQTELEMSNSVVLSDNGWLESQNLEFPLSTSASVSSPLNETYYLELKSSWTAFFHSKNTLTGTFDSSLSSRIVRTREDVEGFIFSAIHDLHGTFENVDLRRFSFSKISFRVPLLHLSDLLQIALDPEVLATFNPFLSGRSRGVIHKSIILWMELCVLEDKTARINSLLQNINPREESLVRENLRREIITIRTWDTTEHVSWLVFEVVGRLQIRPHQYEAVKSLIENPGMISQINMGEGKTRVLLPMLCLYFSKFTQSVIRIVMLSNILEEGYEYLHRYLCASVINMKIVVLPFHRDVEVTRENASLLLHVLGSMRGQNACVIMSPESCLSFQLKLDELAYYNDPDQILPILTQIEDLEYCDLLDESDEELSHKRRIIYSIGTQLDLPSGQVRWECVIELLKRMTFSSDISNLVRVVGVFSSEVKPPSAFQSFYLSTINLDNIWPSIIRALAESIMRSPPHFLRWMSHGYESVETRARWTEYMTNPLSSVDLLDHVILTKENRMDSLHALRGYLAHGLLKSCLQNRHQVQFGVCRPHPKGKRMAIPFRANNIPAERSEFKQPDVAIIYTCLSYFSDGLSLGEVKESLTLLLSLGSSAQSHEFNLWLQLDSSHLPTDVLERIDHVNKIDISNQDQLTEIHKYFSLNMNTISFWLKFILFPRETPLHPESIQRTPWHLCNGSRSQVRGFSGTNDSRFLLPLHVRQESFDEIPDIVRKSSSGKMIHLLLEKSLPYVSLPPTTDAQSTLQWKKLLVLAIQLETHALIDTGALLTGVNNTDAADFLLSLPNFTFRGVVYFDLLKKSWMVKNGKGQVWALHASPIKALDCFTIFDESRCRGADILLRSTAVGLVTLAPRLTKDKLMQGIGRLRMLDRTQRLILVGSDDVSNQICQTNSITRDLPVAVIQWVIENTLQAIRDGLVEWGIQGAHYCFTDRESNRIALLEDFSCKEYYAGRNIYNSPLELYLEKSNLLFSTFGEPKLDQELQIHLKSIKDSMQLLSGEECLQISSGFEEECERELEQEKEVEKEIEIEFIQQSPDSEVDWNYSFVGQWGISDYLTRRLILPLDKVIQSQIKFQSIPSNISWPSNIYCTKNFVKVLTNSKLVKGLNNYLRPVDALLCIDKDIILISEREENELLSIFWAGISLRSGTHQVHLLNLSFLEERGTSALPIPLSLHLGPTPSSISLDDLSILALQVFNGEPIYGDRKNLLPILLTEPASGKKNAMEIVAMRGNMHKLDKSDLDFFDVG